MKSQNANNKISTVDYNQFATSLPGSMFDAAPILRLGGGFSSDMQMAVFSCLTPDYIYYNGGASSLVAFSKSVDYESFQNEYILQHHLKHSWVLFSYNYSYTYIKYVEDDSYTESFYFFETINLPQKIFVLSNVGTAVLNSFGLGAYKAGPDQFRESCGDLFTTCEESGAGLFATLRLSFSSQEDKITFNAHGGIGLLGMKAGFAEIQGVISSNSLNGAFEFAVSQIGGDETELAKIMSKNVTNNQFYSVSCDFAALEDCSGIIDVLLDYSANNFAHQVGFNDGQPYGNVVSRGFCDNATYSGELGLNVGNSVITPDIEDARTNITDTFSIIQSQQQSVNRILASQVASNISSSVGDILRDFTESSNYNTAVILDPVTGAMGCYLTPINCVEIVSNINSQLAYINSTQIENLVEDFGSAYLFSISLLGDLNILFLPIGNGNYYASNSTSNVIMPNQNMMQINNNTVSLTFTQNIIFSIQTAQGGGSIINDAGIEVDSVVLTANSAGIFQGTFSCYSLLPCANQTSHEPCTIELIALDSGIF